jgi:hypothetical protein
VGVPLVQEMTIRAEVMTIITAAADHPQHSTGTGSKT